jgi:uncharacterized protein (DUF2237 family)
MMMKVSTLAALLSVSGALATDDAKNVLGGKLGLCSNNGDAMTGFTRDGRCADEGPADAGAHHVCIEMPTQDNFCTVTGQPNWCSDPSECMGKSGDCPIKNWCVCQWAFARYVKKAGCDHITHVHCDATNMAALTAYEKQGGSDPNIQNALACLKSKCGLSSSDVAASVGGGDSSVAEKMEVSSPIDTPDQHDFRMFAIFGLCGGVVLVGLAAVGLRTIRARQRAPQDEEKDEGFDGCE